MPKTAKRVKENHGMSLELPYQCPSVSSLKFYTTLACDIKRDSDQKKVNNYLERRCEKCMGPVLIKKSKKKSTKSRAFVRV